MVRRAGESNTLLAVSGSDVIAATGGSGSGISRSTDGGVMFQMILPYQLDSPVLISPPNNATGIEQSTTFIWQAVTYASSYEFQLALDEDFDELIENITLEETTFVLGSDLVPGTTYYWRVRSLCDIISSPWSSSVFTVHAPEITIHPASGVAGSNVTIKGIGCISNTAAIVWFDSNNNTVYDNDEPSRSFTTSSDGSFPLVFY